MTNAGRWESLVARWQIRRAIGRLRQPESGAVKQARERLRDLSPQCWPALRRVAFRQRSQLAIEAAELLDELGDPQGLYALLAQFSDRYIYLLFGAELRIHLGQIVGPARIIEVLTGALNEIENPALPREHWSLALSVYALNALQILQAPLPETEWRRALNAFVPNFEDLRTARAVVPNYATGAFEDASVERLMDDWPVGATVAAVRRSAVDYLLSNRRKDVSAFDLLREAFAHPSPQVQLTALYGLRRLRDRRAYVLLQPVAVSRRHPLAKDARRAIESFGDLQPDALTLVRASQPQTAPEQLLRAANPTADADTDTLLRPPLS